MCVNIKVQKAVCVVKQQKNTPVKLRAWTAIYVVSQPLMQCDLPGMYRTNVDLSVDLYDLLACGDSIIVETE